MKRQYIEPSTFCVKLDSKRAFMQNMSINDTTITNSDEGGWAREDNTDNTDDNINNRGNVWDNIW